MFWKEKTIKSSVPVKTCRVDVLSVRLYNSSRDLAQDAAQFAHDYLQDVIAQQGTATVVLATGNSQIKFLEVLIGLGGVDWSRVTLFHLDEYLGIDANHPASFRRYLRERVENQVKPKQFHYIEGDALEPLVECDRYSQLLKAQPIDLCCLGLGENGHLAFNEPSVADFNDPYSVKLVKLDEATRQQQVDGGYFPNSEAVPQYAFTLTIPLINSAKKIFCFVSGVRKATAVKKMLQESISTDCPASVLRTQENAMLFLDADSAGELSSLR
ncbi:MAG TPA: glucosamine-6-phosphate deaminase [Cyanobacteria bacterium UBA8553]|nr:glucosamine-6-phosphate deaminase [Cyanobacteria bacterium UBA8553]HAJ62282.1 glucosamine-6-phosphate deaminase [Cyanobacteria bacterium UBA8543]